VTVPHSRAIGAGFTIIEAMVALVIMAILLAFGMPRMSDWLNATKAAGAAGFYAEGFTVARLQALSNNSQSRLVFVANAGGQPDWRVDICLRTTDTPCTLDSDWSSETAGPKGTTGVPAAFRSIRRSAATLPPTTRLAVTLGPGLGNSVYFTPLGWVDTGRAPRVTRVGLAAPTGQTGAFKSSAVVLTLAGVAVTCDPNAAAGASNGCPQ
jgi:type IV fimbrial biogenesis protein FimT